MAATVTDQLAKLQVAPITMAPKQPEGKLGQPIDVETNVYPLTLKPNVPYFFNDCRVVAVYPPKPSGEEGRKELTKQTKDDFGQIERKSICTEVMHHLINTKAVKKPAIYDRAATLILMEPLKGELSFKIAVKDLPKSVNGLHAIREATRLEVTIKPAPTAQVSTNDLAAASRARGQQGEDRSLYEVLNLATSQKIFNETEKYVVYGTGNAYRLDGAVDNVTREKYIGTGLTKGARIVEGVKNATGQVGFSGAITLDIKKTAFHNDNQRVDEKMEALCDGMRNLTPQALQPLIGVTAYTHYAGATQKFKRVDITIAGFTKEPFNNVVFKDKNGKQAKAIDYIKQRYGVMPKKGHLYGIIDKFSKCTFAPEFLLISPNQRVTTAQAQQRVKEAIVKQSAIEPAKRKAQTAAAYKDAGIADASMKEFGMVGAEKPFSLKGRVLQVPTLLGGVKITPREGAYDAKNVKFLRPAKCERWAIISLASGQYGADPQRVAEVLRRHAGFAGMQLAVPVMCDTLNIGQDHADQMAEILDRVKKAGCQMLVLIADKNVSNHKQLKHAEAEFEVVTQQLTTKVAQDITQGKDDTGRNIVKKLNEKLGGQNYAIDPSSRAVGVPEWFFKSNVMVLGLVVKHPSSMAHAAIEKGEFPPRPAIIGCGVNAAAGAVKGDFRDSTHFSGNFWYSYPREATKQQPSFETSFKDAIRGALMKFKDIRQEVPAHVILLRGGVPEGDFAKMPEEVAMFREVCASISEKYKPNHTFITVNLAHGERFYRGVIQETAKAPAQNLPPGTVIDSVVTDPTRSQTFLQAHKPLHGTAKVPCYVLQFDSGKTMTNDALQAIMHALCYSHNVSSNATALPTPVRIAEECVKRGEDIFEADRRQKGYGSPWTLEDMNKFAITPDHPLGKIRFNA